MKKKESSGVGEMPANTPAREAQELGAGSKMPAISASSAQEENIFAGEAREDGARKMASATSGAIQSRFEEDAPAVEESGGDSNFDARQPEFRVIQPEYDMHEGKTKFKDVGAMWHAVSQKTGKEFYTLKIGKLRLLVFPNQKLAQTRSE